MALTEYQLEILRLLKVLGVPKKEALLAMGSVEDNKRAEKVIDKLLEMEDNNETLTAQKLLKIMATVPVPEEEE